MKREKLVVIGGVAFLAVLAVLHLVVRPARERLSTLRRVVADKQSILAQVRAKEREYRQLESEVNRLRSAIRQPDESRQILSSIERIRETCGLSENTLSLKPATMPIAEDYEETVVEVQLDDVTWGQLVQFLSQLESLEFAGDVKSLEMRRAERSSTSLRAVLQVATVCYVQRP